MPIYLKKILTLGLLLFSYFFNYSQTHHYETIIFEDDEWAYFVGDKEPPVNWRASDFDDSNWENGRGGFGFGDDDDNTIIPKTISLFIRHTFTISDPSIITDLLLDIDYDDALEKFKNWLAIRLAWLDDNMPAAVVTSTKESTEPTPVIRVFPNPSTDYIFIEASKEMEQFSIINQLGQVVKSVASSPFYSKKISVSDLAIGTYFVQLHFGEEDRMVLPFIKN